MTFASIECPEFLQRRFSSESIGFVQLDAPEPGSREDAERTLEVVARFESEWIVLDGYTFDYSYQKQVKAGGVKVMVADDHQFSERWCADVIFNQNPYAEAGTYAEKNDVADGVSFCGIRFALLRSEFCHEKGAPKETGRVSFNKLLITLGGGDPDNCTGAILRVLEELDCSPLQLTVVVGASNPNRNDLQDLASKGRHRIELLDAVDDMSRLMRQHDGIISAGGSTCYEWMVSDMPAAVYMIADNQREIANWLVKNRFAVSLGELGVTGDVDIRTGLQQFLGRFDKLTANDPVLHVDGRGSGRVAAALDGQFDITILTASSGWMKAQMGEFVESLESAGHSVRVVGAVKDVGSGDFLLLLSCWELVSASVRERFLHTLVVHESALPEGRGWSPVTWKVLEGVDRIPVSLIEAVDEVDAGPVYSLDHMQLKGNELLDEIRCEQAAVTFRMVLAAIDSYPESIAAPSPQVGDPTVYARRAPGDSQLRVDETIEEAFPLLRTVDNENYPAYFEYKGRRYELKISRIS